MEHLTETQLNEYLDGLMEAPEQVRVQAHLSSCANCQENLAGLQTVFQALAALPEETLKRDLTPSVLPGLRRSWHWLAWRLAFAIQAGLSLGFLLLLSPFILARIPVMMLGWNGQLAIPEVKFPAPGDFQFILPVIRLPHAPTLAFPVAVTQANLSIWLILGCAAALLFAVGNFSLIFRNNSKGQK